ncbi:MAG: hypothetical protein ACJA0E_002013 [Bermanella sp.]|jgi:hypothetical protein
MLLLSALVEQLEHKQQQTIGELDMHRLKNSSIYCR